MEFPEIQNRLQNYTVGIAGAGGLGSNCAVALVRTGISRLVLADFDLIELSNLNRQYFFKDQIGLIKVEALKANLLRINPEVKIDVFPVRITRENISAIFSSVDILVEAFDQADQKEMLIEESLAIWPKRPIISGNGLAGYGNSNSLRVDNYGSLYICGDNISETSKENPPLAPRVGIVANMQANTAIELLLKRNSEK